MSSPNTSQTAAMSETAPKDVAETQEPGPEAPHPINKSRIPPEHAIEYWQERLVGKRVIAEDAEGDVTERHQGSDERQR